MKIKGLRDILNKLLYPPVWAVVILVAASAVLLTVVFANRWDMSPIAYVSYVTAFYTLTVVCLASVNAFPRWYKAVRQNVYKNKFANRYMTDAAFKTHVSLYRSLVINLLYVAINLVSGLIYRSAWFVILAVYYTILALMRFILLRFVHRTGIGKDRVLEFRSSRLCGVILMTINLTLSGAVLMILYQNRGYEYNGILIYVMALYTFYITTSAVINIVKYRKYNSPVMSTSKIINLSAALVSMLSLETAMLSQFGADTLPKFRRIMIAATGAGVSLTVVSISVYMIIRATKEIRRLSGK